MATLDRSVQRKVFFFRVENASLVLASLQQAICHIATLAFNDQGRYLPTVSEDIVHALFVTRDRFPIQVQFGRIRRADLPLVENRGAISPLNIAATAGVLDWGHIVIFEDGIVAAEFNRDAPRLARLGEYLLFKARGKLDTVPRFLPLFERAALNKLSAYDSVTVLEVEAPTSEADAVENADPSLGAAFRACQAAGHAKTARLVLKNQNATEPKGLLNLTRRLLTNPRSREVITLLKIRGKTDGGSIPLDLFEEYIVSTETFIRLDGRTKAISSDHAFNIIETAYKQNSHRFEDAATAADLW